MEMEMICETLKAGVTEFCSLYSGNGQEISDPDKNIPLHKHPSRELLFVVEGESCFILNTKKFHLSKRCAVLIDSWVPHSFEYGKTDSNLLHLWFYFSENRVRARLCKVGMYGRYTFTSRPLPLPPHVYALFISRWNDLKKQERKTPELESFYLHTPFDCILEEVLFQMVPEKKKPQESPDIVNAIKLYIESQNARGCSLKQLEKVFGYNSFYLAHRFKKVTGISVGDYINQTRLAFTEDAMMKGLKQKEIAYELGFSSSAAFWKWCQKNKK